MKAKKRLLKYTFFTGIIVIFFNMKNLTYASNISLKGDGVITGFGGTGIDYFVSATNAQDGGYVFVGDSYSVGNEFENKGGCDGVIVKYDANGNQDWAKNFGGSSNDSFNSITETQDGGFIVAGSSLSTNAGFTNKGNIDAIIVKFDKDGNQLWVKNFGGLSDDYFNHIIETPSGDIIAVGNSSSTNANFTNKGSFDATIVKFDKDGNQLWVKNFGGLGKDGFRGVTNTQDGGYIAVGYSYSADAGFKNKGLGDAIIVKYNEDGKEVWTKSLGGANNETFRLVVESKNGELIAIGESNSTDIGVENKGNNDAIIVKYSSSGTQKWIKNFGGSNNDYFYSILTIQDNECIAIGYSSSVDAGFENKGGVDSFLIKYDESGNEEWIKSFGGIKNDYFRSAIITPNNKLVVAGYSNSTDIGFENKGDDDAIMVQYEVENNISSGLELKTASANLDIYIKPENTLILSLDTNSIIFEDFSGVEDMEKANAVNITVSSSLPYQLNAYLPTEIQNADKSNTMDKSILNIKENSEADYQTFANTIDKIVLKDNCSKGNDIVHSIDLMLKGGIAHEKDVYKTTIKFEAEQK